MQTAPFRFDASLKVWLHRDPVDFRKSIDGLAAMVAQSMQRDPLIPGIFAFTNTAIRVSGSHRHRYASFHAHC